MSDEVRVLLIEDDEDDELIVRDLLSRSPHSRFQVHWESTYEQGLRALCEEATDVCLLDHGLGSRTGIELLGEARQRGCSTPVILLTGQRDPALDVGAMHAGADDYLIKGRIDAALLERSIRYAVERGRAQQALRASRHELERLSRQLLSAQEVERTYVAQEIHDRVGQVLAAIKFTTERAAVLLGDGGPAEARRALDKAVTLTQEAVDEVRRIQKDLRPPTIDDLGILDTMEAFCRDFQLNHPGVAIERAVAVSERAIPAGLKIVIYRIVQEAVGSAVNHARAGKLSLLLRREEDRIALAVADNGAGAPASDSGRALVLAALKERAELSGGSLVVHAAPGEGTRIDAVWTAAAVES